MKIGFDRRQFLAGSAGAFSMALLPESLWAAAAVGSAVPPAPVARIDVAHDTYFGETLSDPYRWMENDKDPGWLPFLKGQNDHARALLDAFGRDMDHNLREMGVGDLAVPKQIKRMMEAFYGRARADSQRTVA